MRLAVLVDHFPALSETFVVNEIVALHRLGHAVTVETAAWADPRAEVPEPVPVFCLDDDRLGRRLADLAWLALRHPRGCVRDLRARRRWRREEIVRPLRVLAPQVRRIVRRGDEHLHAQFAAGVALDALRIGRLLGISYSVVCHAYDIYREPRNLSEKLAGAKVAAGVSEYSVRHLREVAGPGDAARVRVLTLGVDHEVFRRSTPYPGGRTLLAVGRMVEKKGFGHLLEAAARVHGRAPLDRVTLVGDGPLRAELEEQARALGIGGLVEFTGSRPSSGVREALERTDLLVIPAVPVDDGDRDVAPMIAPEALAMGVPIVASDFVGLPEVVREPWGRLVPPGDVDALAAAISDVLDRPPAERAAMGEAGRAFVVAERDLADAAGRLVELIQRTPAA